MDILDTLLRWIVHAAIFQGMWSLGASGLVVGVVALVVWIGRRGMSRRRHEG